MMERFKIEDENKNVKHHFESFQYFLNVFLRLFNLSKTIFCKEKVLKEPKMAKIKKPIATAILAFL
jgi:hypothetical protein